jgi:hypothetical protein
LDDPLAIDEDTVYATINNVTAELGLKTRSQLMTPLRYALTGRKVRIPPEINADDIARTKCPNYDGDSRYKEEFSKTRSRFETPEKDFKAGLSVKLYHTIVVTIDMHHTYLRFPCLPARFGPLAGPRFWAVL